MYFTLNILGRLACLTGVCEVYQTFDRLDFVKNAFNCKLQDFSFSSHLSPQTQGDVLEQTPVHSLMDHSYTNKKDETHNPTIPQNGQTHSNNSLGICRKSS